MFLDGNEFRPVSGGSFFRGRDMLVLFWADSFLFESLNYVCVPVVLYLVICSTRQSSGDE